MVKLLIVGGCPIVCSFALSHDTPGSVEVVFEKYNLLRNKAGEATLSALMLCKNGKELMRCGTDADLFKSR